MSNTQVTTNNKHAKTSGDKPLRIGTGLPGPGRPKKATEQQAQQLSVTAIKRKYGSLEKGLVALLESKEPSLIRLVFEYALGKPESRIASVNGVPFSQLNIQIVQTNKVDNGTTEHTNNQGISDTTGK